MVRTLSELGAAVIIVDLDSASCRDLSARLTASGAVTGMALPGDISNVEFWTAAPTSIVRAVGGLDIIVHCAAFVGTTRMDGWAVPFAEQTTEAWNAAIDVNISSFFTMVRELQPLWT